MLLALKSPLAPLAPLVPDLNVIAASIEGLVGQREVAGFAGDLTGGHSTGLLGDHVHWKKGINRGVESFISANPFQYPRTGLLGDRVHWKKEIMKISKNGKRFKWSLFIPKIHDKKTFPRYSELSQNCAFITYSVKTWFLKILSVTKGRHT